MPESEPLFPEHGGFRNLKTFQLARLVYDLTARFCKRYFESGDRTIDQMVQAARSGTQNIAEGSRFSGTSRKIEMNLTNTARSSLEELRLDYEDFLRQRDLPQWSPDHAALVRFKRLQCGSMEQFADWVRRERKREEARAENFQSDGAGLPPAPSSAIAANGMLSLLNLLDYLLKRQVESQGEAFEREGGFSERLHRRRLERRQEKPAPPRPQPLPERKRKPPDRPDSESNKRP